MKLIAYIRPTARRPAKDQAAALKPHAPAFIVIDGQDGRDWSTALKMLRRGNGLVIENIGTLGRRYDTRVERIEAVAGKGASIVLADGSIHGPDCAPSIVAGMSAPKSDAPRVAHNRTDDDTLAEAKRLWTGREFRAMTNGQIAEAVGLSIPTLTRYFGARGIRKAGRPRKA